jgi:hypothetical protein
MDCQPPGRTPTLMIAGHCRLAILDLFAYLFLSLAPCGPSGGAKLDLRRGGAMPSKAQDAMCMAGWG